MPKPLRVMIEVEEIALGAVMRLLHQTPGVASFSLVMDDKPPASGEHIKETIIEHGTRPLIFLTALSEHSGKANAAQLAHAFAAAGYKISTTYQIAHELKKAGLITSPKNGTYELTAKGKVVLVAAAKKGKAALAAAKETAAKGE